MPLLGGMSVNTRACANFESPRCPPLKHLVGKKGRGNRLSVAPNDSPGICPTHARRNALFLVPIVSGGRLPADQMDQNADVTGQREVIRFER